jgi:hypothetical protein
LRNWKSIFPPENIFTTPSALLAAACDDRVKTLILISDYDPDEPMEIAARRLDLPMLFIDTETTWVSSGTIHVHSLTKRGQLMIYPRLGHSHHIQYFCPQMKGFIADYMERIMPASAPLYEYVERPLM